MVIDTNNEQTPLFENSYEITAAVIKKQNKPCPKTTPVKFWFLLASKIIYGILAVTMLFVAVKTRMPTSAFIFVILVCVVFVKTLFDTSINVRIAISLYKREHGESTWIRRARFFGDRVEHSNGNITQSFSYGQFRYISEHGDYIFLWTDSTYVAVDTAAFTLGNVFEFRAFIGDKTAAVRQIRSSAQQNRVDLKRSIIPLGLLVFLCVYAIPSFARAAITIISPSDPPTMAQILERHWDEELTPIGMARLTGGAVIFAHDEGDGFYVSLFRETGGGMYWVDGHSYSITGINNWSRYDGVLFESEGVAFSGGTQQVIYGVAAVEWWNTFPEHTRDEYTSRRFRHGNSEFVLYHRITEN
jgi:Ca2+/Na+ antiporter